MRRHLKFWLVNVNAPVYAIDPVNDCFKTRLDAYQEKQNPKYYYVIVEETEEEEGAR